MKRFLLYSGIKKYSRQQVKKAKRKYFFEHHIYLLKTLKFNKIALKNFSLCEWLSTKV